MFYSLKNRLIAFFAILLVFSFGTMSYLVFQESRATIRSYIESSALEKMGEYGSYVSMLLSQLYDLSSIVFNSDITKSWDSTQSEHTATEGEKKLSSIAFSQFLTKTTNSYSNVSSVTVYRENGEWVGVDNSLTLDRTFLGQSWYQEFKTGSVHWVRAHTDAFESQRGKKDPVVSLLLPVGTFEPTQARSVMKVNVSSAVFTEPLNRIHLGESGSIYLLDHEGRPVVSQEEFESQHADAVPGIREIQQAVLDKEGIRYVKNERGGRDMLVYKKLAQNGWILVGFVSEEDLFAKLYRLRSTIAVFTGALLVFAIIMATWLSYGITKPLSRLASAMRYIQKGDFALAESRIPPQGSVRNEVGYVTATFRTMVQQLRHHIKTEFELKLLRQQAEYKALLMQINPHFLFNTLELLSSLAMQQRTNDTVQVIESLGKMMRFSLRISDDLVRLKEEWTYLRYYVSILGIRLGERLTVTMEEEGELDRVEVVKFILQPLVENAVKYGAQHQTDIRIAIRAAREGDRLRLEVADNGPGMPPELVRELQEELAAARLEEVLRTADRQIGLRNVLARCQLYYGPGFRFSIESEPGLGTRIRLEVPAQERGDAHVPRIDRG
ncbi:cache domain-containing sensor histidine kinase [Gorillibacterium sp. sgz5001074]|uniref:cache domain-containing sensor histidine kinase n=1 Tax=Gorillibacterium sp. sgz5001074 TaxID=3446695 RepID=UPI003F6809C4